MIGEMERELPSEPMKLQQRAAFPRTRLHADILLLVTATIWGTAFVVQRMVANQIGVITFTGLRFLIGGIVLLPLAWRSLQGHGWKLAGASAVLGAILFGGAALQQLGLQTTTAANAGFITGTYVIIIPILMAVFWQKRQRFWVWVAACMALGGLFLLSTGGRMTQVNSGDLFELVGAFFWAMHVILVGRFVRQFPALPLAVGQFLMCGIIGISAGFAWEGVAVEGLRASWWAVLYTGMLSIAVGYTFQVVAQQIAPPADTAIILNGEAVMAAISGWIILNERLGAVQIAGCGLILAGILVSQIDGTVKVRKGMGEKG